MIFVSVLIRRRFFNDLLDWFVEEPRATLIFYVHSSKTYNMVLFAHLWYNPGQGKWHVRRILLSGNFYSSQAQSGEMYGCVKYKWSAIWRLVNPRRAGVFQCLRDPDNPAARL